MGLLKALSDCKHHAPLAIRKLANLAYYNPDVHYLHPSVKIITVDSCSFYVTDGMESVQAIKDNPIFRNVRPDDVCLDIGAGIGAFTIPLAKMAKKVIAIEPLYNEELKQNIALNSLTNVSLHAIALGNDDYTYISYNGRKTKAIMFTYGAMLYHFQQEKIDFLKLDCEGAEWSIIIDELAKVREIRAELHIRREHEQSDHLNFLYWEAWLKKHNFSGTCEKTLKNTDFDPNFKECYYINYSKIEN